MTKKLISVAVAALFAAPAFAQSNVVITGRVAGGVETYKLSGTTSATDGSVNQVSNNGSRIIFKGSEDLGGGLKAFFQVDTRVQLDTAAKDGNLGSGNTGVGLQGGFGKVSLGRWDLHYNEGTALEKHKALSDQTSSIQGIVSQINGTNVARVSRSSNAIVYDTPSFSGFNARVAYSSNPAAEDGAAGSNADKDGAYNLAARYINGPINAGVSYWRLNAEGTTNSGDERSTRGWFGYKFGGLNIGLVLDQSKRRPAANADFVKRTAWALPVTYAMGAHAIHFHYAVARDLNGTGNSNTGAKEWMLGYEYALSKRTHIGANYLRLSNESAAIYNPKGVGTNVKITTAGQDASQLYFGIRHDF